MVAVAVAGEPVEVSLKSGKALRGELVSVLETCAGEIIDERGTQWVIGTEAIESAWMTADLEAVDPGAVVLQVQGFFDVAGLRVDGRPQDDVAPGALVGLSPGLHVVRLDVPACGKQRWIVEALPGVVTPLVYNRPTEQYYVFKGVGAVAAVVLYEAVRYTAREVVLFVIFG